MTKSARREIDRAVAVAASNPSLAAAIVSMHHRMAATAKDSRELAALAESLALPVQFVNGCMVPRY